MVQILPLGAGNDVGRSCISIQHQGIHILLDCGIHAGHSDQRKFPDFSFINVKTIDCVIISHFHLDHVGALPYLTEHLGYNGPILMSAPTKAISAVLLKDAKRFQQAGPFKMDNKNIEDCLDKVTILGLNETKSWPDFQVTAHYAGHVLGAIMTQITIGDVSLVYTGDFNMTSDRHLGQAHIERLMPDVLISEATYGTYTRPPRANRERSFLQKVHTCIAEGGKVLIPTFAVGRAQELCVMLESHWQQHGLTAPIFFSGDTMEQANDFYKLYLLWTNVDLDAPSFRNPFEFRYVQKFDTRYVDNPEPCVVFASPGMMECGFSARLFLRWCHDSRNLVVLPGYCVYGTIGWQLLNGETSIRHRGQVIQSQIQVENLSYSAHSDSKGIMELVQQSGAKNVVLVHGSKSSIDGLKKTISKELSIPCFTPDVGQAVHIRTTSLVRIDTSAFEPYYYKVYMNRLKNTVLKDTRLLEMRSNPVEAVLVGNKLLPPDQAGLRTLSLTYWFDVSIDRLRREVGSKTWDDMIPYLWKDLLEKLQLQRIPCQMNSDGLLLDDMQCIQRTDQLGLVFSNRIEKVKIMSNILKRTCL